MININRFTHYILGARDKDGISMGLIFSIGGLFFPIVALWNSRAVVPFIAIMALCAIGLIVRHGLIKSLLKCDFWLVIGLCGFLFAAVHGAFHVTDAKDAFVSTTKIFANALLAVSLFFAATFLTRQEAMAAARSVTIGTFFVGSFLLCDVLSSGVLSFFFTNMTVTTLYKFFWFKSASATFAICSLIAGFYLVLNKQYWNAAILIAVSIFVQIEIGNRTAAGGLIVALMCGLGYHWLGQIRKIILTTIVILLFLAPSYILSTGFSAEKISQFINVRTSATISLVYRMYAWEFVLDRISERPVIGWGLDGSKEFGGESAVVISDSIMGTLGEPVPSHPHNGVLEVWLELGIFGALSLLLLVLRGIIIFDRRCLYATSRIWTFSVLTLLTCFYAFSFSAFSSAWIANIIFTIAMTYPLSRYGDMVNAPKIAETTKNQ